MNFLNVGEAIKNKGAPLLGNVIKSASAGLLSGGTAGAAVAGVASLVTGIANLFDADPAKPDDIINKINADPDAALKLKQLELDNQIKLAELASTRSDNAEHHAEVLEEVAAEDTASARMMNSSQRSFSQRWIDEFAKITVLTVCASILIIGLNWMIHTSDLTPAVATIVTSMMNGAWTVFVTIAGFYYGTSKGSQGKDETIYAVIQALKTTK